MLLQKLKILRCKMRLNNIIWMLGLLLILPSILTPVFAILHYDWFYFFPSITNSHLCFPTFYIFGIYKFEKSLKFWKKIKIFPKNVFQGALNDECFRISGWEPLMYTHLKFEVKHIREWFHFIYLSKVKSKF